ncbi:hypothetical protein GTO89_00075 [Heliobacterium gestii]|uniref:Pyridoxamine 5'-phosphate oxidase putative domain-containing protein n=1 Tax=Heliomicrobium gestii TaxID=2699 RepID=A0A845L4D3_HELGE|nr:pyridoxamine 5'-phosphate oxidase family protein [Heliomicrobium gestii]MBM7865158.1 uncharacterized protein YhbP (UPF0306 family) [Heliomicrobium gestii]MZP41427.1 hypothetical protein [Heliomicrobium gestii]
MKPLEPAPAELRRLAESIAAEHRAMALAVVSEEPAPGPWLAPVYYIHRDFQFYFFSSPSSRHAAATAETPVAAAAAIYNEPDDYGAIRGLQMAGTLAVVTDWKERSWATAAFGARFSFFGRFLREPRLMLELRKNELYRFAAQEVYITDNRSGFGRRYRYIPADME